MKMVLIIFLENSFKNSNHSKVNYSNKNNADQIFEDFQFDRQYDVSYKPTKKRLNLS